MPFTCKYRNLQTRFEEHFAPTRSIAIKRLCLKPTAYGIFGEHGLLIQMHDPIVVRQYVDVVFQAVLQSARLEQRPRLRTANKYWQRPNTN